MWLVNVLLFALWFWQLDGGGPLARPACVPADRDFLFPQQTEPELMEKGWRPLFLDYLFVSFTNATAFSPTDTMPLSRWAKMLMLVQSAISLSLAVMVVGGGGRPPPSPPPPRRALRSLPQWCFRSGASECTCRVSLAFPRNGRLQFCSIVWSSE
jgi:hypothetical protein